MHANNVNAKVLTIGITMLLALAALLVMTIPKASAYIVSCHAWNTSASWGQARDCSVSSRGDMAAVQYQDMSANSKCVHPINYAGSSWVWLTGSSSEVYDEVLAPSSCATTPGALGPQKTFYSIKGDNWRLYETGGRFFTICTSLPANPDNPAVPYCYYN